MTAKANLDMGNNVRAEHEDPGKRLSDASSAGLRRGTRDVKAVYTDAV